MSKQSEFPVPNMPRMGRRNAVAYPNIKSVVSSDGAFSPINLINRASTDDYANLDPDGRLTQGFQRERLHQIQRDSHPSGNQPVLNSTPKDDWKQIVNLDGTRLVDPTEPQKVQGTLAVLQAKQRARQEHMAKEVERLDTPRLGTPFFPWKKKDETHGTLADERQRMFQSFNLTSYEPPDTPKASEQKLKKVSKRKRKQESGKRDKSQESVASSTIPKAIKRPYSNVNPKVNTGMRLDPQGVSEDWKLHGFTSHAPADFEKEVSGKNLGPAKTSTRSVSSTRNAKTAAAVSPAKPVKTKKLVNNYPAAESVKNVPHKLPLTIGSNLKKNFISDKLTERVELAEDSGTTRLYPLSSPQQKIKYETKPGFGHAMFRATTPTHLPKVPREMPSRNPMTPAPVDSAPSASAGKKPPTPALTTIQAPPSPFFSSNVSIPNQLTVIPINGEKGKEAKGSTNNSKRKTDGKRGKFQRLQRPADNSGQGKAAQQTESLEKPIVKVVPSLGSSPNKYNNIFIGPYSGSESEGEAGSKKKH